MVIIKVTRIYTGRQKNVHSAGTGAHRIYKTYTA